MGEAPVPPGTGAFSGAGRGLARCRRLDRGPRCALWRAEARTMQSDSPTNNARYPGDNESVTDPDRSSSVNEWIDIGRLIEQQIRRDVARVVGAEKTDRWGDVRDTVTGRIRERAAGVD